MNEQLQPGKYVVAVSGGVDSVVLLHQLYSRLPQGGHRLIVAHYDHGIRSDSAEDRLLVEKLAKEYGLPFYYEEGYLGPRASEALAREKRYEFLRKVQHQTGAKAIITAHHQNDLLETAILNLLRGTGRKGVSALLNSSDIVRPNIGKCKAELVNYAQKHGLTWREDSTNSDETYARNYVRRHLVPRLGENGQRQMLAIIHESARLNEQIDAQIAEQLNIHGTQMQLDRLWFARLPHAVAKEIMASWLRAAGLRSFDSQMLERVVVLAKTLRPGKKTNLYGRVNLRISETDLVLE